MNDLTKEETSIAAEMLKCFKNAIKFSRVQRLDTLDVPEKTTLKERAKNMYGLDIEIWDFEPCKVTYKVTSSLETNVFHQYQMIVDVIWVYRIYKKFFNSEERIYSPLHFDTCPQLSIRIREFKKIDNK